MSSNLIVKNLNSLRIHIKTLDGCERTMSLFAFVLLISDIELYTFFLDLLGFRFWSYCRTDTSIRLSDRALTGKIEKGWYFITTNIKWFDSTVLVEKNK